MGRTSGAIGFALYLDLLEQLECDQNDYDIDTVLLYSDDTEPLELTKAVDELSKEGSVLVCTQKPKSINCRKIMKITKEGLTLEDNG